MPIVAYPSIQLAPREEVLSSIAAIIDEAADAPYETTPHDLAEEILDIIEPKINSVDHDGNVIYRI